MILDLVLIKLNCLILFHLKNNNSTWHCIQIHHKVTRAVKTSQVDIVKESQENSHPN